jgi:hypothetical protein
MSYWKIWRLNAVMWLARRLGVPVDVHATFFMSGKNTLSVPSCSGVPK